MHTLAILMRPFVCSHLWQLDMLLQQTKYRYITLAIRYYTFHNNISQVKKSKYSPR